MSSISHMRYVVFLILVFLLALGCEGEGDPVGPPFDSVYPTTVFPLSIEEHAARSDELRSQFPRVCSDLDEYGHLVRRVGPGPSCFSQTSVGIAADAPVQPLIDAAKANLVEMFEFTGVADPGGLTVRSVSIFAGTEYSRGFLTVRFANQRFKGHEVLSTSMIAWVDSAGVIGASGRHYPDIQLPLIGVLPTVAEQSVVGMEIPWLDTVGLEHIFVVTRNSFWGDPVEVVIPTQTDDSIELRAAWEVRVGSGGLHWYVYIDFVTGKHLRKAQLFNT